MKLLIFILVYFAIAYSSTAKGFPFFVETYNGTIRYVSKEPNSFQTNATFRRDGRFVSENGQFSLKFQKGRKFVFEGFFFGFVTIAGSYHRSVGLIRFSAQKDRFSIKGRIRKASKHFFIVVHEDFRGREIDYVPSPPTPTPEPTP